MKRSQKLGTVKALFVALCLCLSACGSHEPAGAVDAQASKVTPSPPSTPLADSERQAAGTDNDPEDDSDAETKDFHGYRCTDDCSGHQAGYDWAEEHNIDDVDDCGGNSQSFIEGCQAWIEENH